MPTLNDFGDAGVYRVEQQATELAKRLGIQPEIIIQFFNDKAHFPQTLGELEAWGNDPSNNEYGVRRRAANGVWTPISQGVTPGKDENDPGFKHRITNEVGKIQRFQQVDAQGNVFGGSFDPEYNKAHPELAGKTGAQTGLAGQSGPIARSASGMSQALTGAASGGAPKSLEDMTSELRNAGYGGPWDEASVRATYQRTATPNDGGTNTGGPTGSGGYTDLMNQVADTNREKWEHQKLVAQHDMALADTAEKRQQAYQDYLEAQQGINAGQFQDTRYDTQRQTDLSRNQADNQYNLNRFDTQNQNTLNRYDQNTQFQQGRYDTQRSGDMDRYSTMAQNLLKASVDLGSRPQDYFKYNQMLSGGKDILAQLSGNQATADFSAPTGQLQAGNVGDVLKALGMSGYGSMPHSGPDQNQTEAEWMAARGPGARPVIGPEPVTPRPDLPFMPANTDYRVGATQAVPRLKAAYDSLIKSLGVTHLAASDPRMIALYKSMTGLDDMGARAVAGQAAQYYAVSNGAVVPDGVLAGLIAQEHSLQQNTDPGQRSAANMVQAYAAKLHESGKTAMEYNDPQLQDIYRNIAGLDPAAALAAARRSADFYNSSGGVPATGSDLVNIITQAKNQSGAQAKQPQQTPQAWQTPQPTRQPTATGQSLMRTAQEAAQPRQRITPQTTFAGAPPASAPPPAAWAPSAWSPVPAGWTPTPQPAAPSGPPPVNAADLPQVDPYGRPIKRAA